MGIGIGLSCSKVLAKALGGDIFVMNSDLKGTCIRYFIPVNLVLKDEFDLSPEYSASVSHSL
jgi:signal transduction histidine kinase